MILKKIISVSNKNTGTVVVYFAVGRWNYFTNSYDFFLRTLRHIRTLGGMRTFRNEIPIRLSEVDG